MAKIIYGIHSDGLGHYPRSKTVIDHLICKGHEVKVVTGDTIYDLMKNDYDCIKIKKMIGSYKNNKIDWIDSIKVLFKQYLKNINIEREKVKKISKKFGTDLIICDNDMVTPLVAIEKKIPLIYIANGYSVSHTDATKDFTKFSDKIRLFFNIPDYWNPRSEYVKKYIILSFFKANLINKKSVMIPPIIKEDIIKARLPKEKNHILVYQTTDTNKKLPQILKSLPNEKFIIYGFHKDLKDKNLTFKKNSVKQDFLKDLLTCKAIITNGGFSLISEGLFLHKPILSNPIGGQLEQATNATQLEKLGFGKYVKKLTPQSIKIFLYDLPTYKKNLVRYKQKDNATALKIIDAEIAKALKH